MIIDKHGIVLESLSRETAELVRQWRNNSEINKFMDYQEIITKEQQRRWFEKIQLENSTYFIIKKKQLPIGMIHIDQVDLRNGSAHAGLFVGDINYHGTGIVLAASLCLLEYAFETLHLNEVLAKVKNNNYQAIEYNKFLGFLPDEKINTDFSKWKITSEKFYSQKKELLRYLAFL